MVILFTHCFNFPPVEFHKNEDEDEDDEDDDKTDGEDN